MVFSKKKWLESANKQVEEGFLSTKEVNDALEIWVNDLDGKARRKSKQAAITTSIRSGLNNENHGGKYMPNLREGGVSRAL